MDKKVNSGTEFVNKRTQAVWNTEAGSIVSDGNTGNEKLQISHQSGGNLNFTNKSNSEFAPNNKQTLVHGNKFETTAGDSFTTTNSNKEERVYGDLTVITGSPNFFTNPIAEDWIEANKDIAAAKAAPEYTYGAVGNNSGAEYVANGTPDSESGAVEGGSYQPNPVHANIPGLMEEKAGDIANIERQMGTGGSIKMMSAKHIFIQSGAKAVTFDSGAIVPNGKSVTRKYIPEDGSLTEVKTAVPIYENKDTSGAVPFGDVHISAGTKLRVVTGSGGASIKSAGEVNINSTGRLMLGGAEIAIGGSTNNNAGRVTVLTDKDVFIESGDLITMVAPNITNVVNDQVTYVTPEAVFSGNLHVQGNLTVEGNITVNGSTGITVPNGDVVASGISLVNHRHSGVCTGSGNTGSPI